ncbi:hypothetical protein [Microvirga antarctica]|uniref:hypothetical protein n=1 Tax=Microvirga antarctica TaxID=2819233 RepID=UPI001B305876|nr:hypothetical protein [Microvirga antarctica]
MTKRILRSALACALAIAPLGSALAESAEKPAKELTVGQKAARERMTQCSTEWKAAKAAGKTEAATTWPKFWSACNTRLKAVKA